MILTRPYVSMAKLLRPPGSDSLNYSLLFGLPTTAALFMAVGFFSTWATENGHPISHLLWLLAMGHFLLVVVGWYLSAADGPSSTRSYIDEGMAIARCIRKDKQLDQSWRDRARLIESALSSCRSRLDTYAKMPSVKESVLENQVRQLHESAVALAHHQLLAGISAHAEIVARDVDSVLASYAALT